MKKIPEKYLLRVIIGIITTLAVLHFIVNFELIQNTKLIEQSWVNIINGYILTITMSTGLIFLIGLAFFISKETARDLERFLLKNLTTACFLVIFLLFYFLGIGKLDKEFALTAIGATIVFWYGYKTYERDKELQMIEKFDNGELTIENFDEDLGKLAHAFYLKEKGYLPEYLWKRIDLKIDKLVFDFFNDNLKGKDITEFLENKKISDTLAKIKYEGGFMDYFIGKIEDFHDTVKDHDFSLKEKQEMDKIINLIIKLYQLLNQKH